MLARSNSSAGERLRRAKSTSSTHTSSSGHQRTRTSIDPFVSRQQAETAALEAYQRAREHEHPVCPDYRPVPPKLQRRRSQVSGKSEGSHLEDFRLGRRRSNSKKENVSKAKAVPAQQLAKETTVEERNGDEISIRRRYVVPPNPRNRLAQSEHGSLPSSGRHPRRSGAGYADGSPVARSSSAIKEKSSTLQLRTPRGDYSDGYSANLSRLSDFGQSEDYTTQAINTRHHDADAVTMARDKCLQDFHQHKLRERKSFILGPLQKLRTATVNKSGGSNFDTKLPPFNYADELVPPPPLPLAISAAPVQVQKKSRNFSDSLKGRFRKVFRKVSRAPSGLPVQHIEAKDFRFSTYATPSVSTTSTHDDPFISVSDQQSIATQEFPNASVSTRASADDQSIAKSRVTSWTNSTMADASSTRNGPELEESATENVQLKRSDSMSTLRRAPSLFGRSLKKRLHRPSKAELRSSEESEGLYSALQERINPMNQSANDEEAPIWTTTSALATLPSQQRANSAMSSNRRGVAPTIRSVTPEPPHKLDILSPVSEVLSPQASVVEPSSHQDGRFESTPRSYLQRRPAMKAPTPSKELIARRIEKSKNRWQSPLDEMSPPSPSSRRAAATTDDNPYELQSLSQAFPQPAINNDLPHHARVEEKLPSTRYDVLSPSVYSRKTDGETPQPDSPGEKGDMMVTITGREVRSYSISPAKREQHNERHIQGSADWRQWLSSEINGFNDWRDPDQFSLPSTVLKDPESHHMGARQIYEQPQTTQDKGSGGYSHVKPDPSHARELHSHALQDHVKPDSNQYIGGYGPIHNGGAHSNDVIAQHSSNRNPSANITAASSVQNADDARNSDESATQVAKKDSNRQLSNNASTREPSNDSTNAYKPRSAFDLRANYKTGSSAKARPIAVRRSKSSKLNNIQILEDTTIQNISAGPYASEQRTASNAATHSNLNSINKENSPPPPSADANSLPVVSSSEWLAAGTNKKRDIKGTSGLRVASRSRSVSKHSPARSPTTIVPSGGSSPGQRLVTNWLDGKRSKENSPAFV